MNRRLVKLAILVALAFQPTIAKSDVVYSILEAYSMGTLKRTVDEPFTTFTTLATFGYSWDWFSVHGFFETMNLDYKVAENTYQGTYALSGLGMSAIFARSPRGWFLASLELPYAANYTILSESSGTVQGSSYKHSEMTILSGGTAAQLRVGYNFLTYGRPGKRGEQMAFGIYGSYLTQSFKKQSTIIKTNNSTLAPLSQEDTTVDYSVSILSLFFGLYHDM